MRRIACLGEVMIELAPLEADTVRVGVAGDTYNTAVYLRRALDPETFSVSYVTALGDDAMSDRILEQLRAEDLDTDLIEIRAGSAPGLYMISLDPTGERSFSYWRSAAAARTLFSAPCRVDPGKLDGSELVYLSGISIAILPQDTRDLLCDWIDQFRAQGGKLTFDSNYRPRLWEDVDTAQRETMRLWSRCDIGLPSLDDELALFEDKDAHAVCDRLGQAGVAQGALKCGGDGAISLQAERVTSPIHAVTKVVDTTAAGDSYNAGFLAAYLNGEDSAACMQSGHNLASRVIGHAGAIIPRDAT